MQVGSCKFGCASFLVQVGSCKFGSCKFGCAVFLVHVGSCKFGCASFLVQVGSCKFGSCKFGCAIFPVQVGTCKFGCAISRASWLVQVWLCSWLMYCKFGCAISRASWLVQVWLCEKAGDFTGRTLRNAFGDKTLDKGFSNRGWGRNEPQQYGELQLVRIYIVAAVVAGELIMPAHAQYVNE